MCRSSDEFINRRMEFDDMGRDTNIEIFKDTENLVKKNPILKEAVTASTRMQKVILETENVGCSL